MSDQAPHRHDTADRLACQQVVRTLIAQYQWTLLSEDDLVELLLHTRRIKQVKKHLRRRLLAHYALALYSACRQTDDQGRRECAYRDLFHYLYRSAYKRWPDLADDATQRALVLVYEQIDSCQSPATFLAFALFKLRQAVTEELRARSGDWLPEEHLADVESNQPETPSVPLLQERRQTLLAAIDRLSDQQQRQVLQGLFFGVLCPKEIGARLGITRNYVGVLRHRAVARLREDSRLKDYFASG